MKLKIMLLTAAFALVFPQAARAECTGFIDCLFGFTARTEIRNQRMIEEQRIQADRDRQVADLEAQQAERERLADLEVERVRQQQYATEAQRDLAIAQEQARVMEYKASLQALVDEKAENIRAQADTQIAALNNAALIHVTGLTQSGETERTRITWGWVFSAIVALVAGLTIWRRQGIQAEQWRIEEDRRRDQLTADLMERIELRGYEVEIRTVKNGQINRV